ncbi:MAG: glutamate-5-semialdehyde dehydrogenase [Lachnospiraceae bacterium]|nr:glutamate-5-semialdehyde dehydrogenase [Lachnospiraceae bacterium]
MSSYITEIGERAKAASVSVKNLSTDVKNRILRECSDALKENIDMIIDANRKDVEAAKKRGLSEAMIDRLTMTEKRIMDMAAGLITVMGLADPVGEVISMTLRPNGLQIGKKRVPLGVIAMIYESRPNVTVDAFGLCFKAGNVCILRGGSDAVNTNSILAQLMRDILNENNVNPDALIFVEKTDREYVDELLKLNDYIDVIIPRGGAGLINNVIKNSTVPVIQTGVGNCHIYVDKLIDDEMTLSIIENAKTQRYGTCNTCESLVVHSEVAERIIPKIYELLTVKHGVEIRGDERSRAIVPEIKPATEEDYYTEYLDKIISLKVVDHTPEAIDFINEHSSGHSEAIVTKNYNHAMRFLNEIDSAAVYVNASTRFTDGAEFGYGAEIGISTQKLHARGPLGLNELTTIKYIIFGTGQIRE